MKIDNSMFVITENGEETTGLFEFEVFASNFAKQLNDEIKKNKNKIMREINDLYEQYELNYESSMHQEYFELYIATKKEIDRCSFLEKEIEKMDKIKYSYIKK